MRRNVAKKKGFRFMNSLLESSRVHMASVLWRIKSDNRSCLPPGSVWSCIFWKTMIALRLLFTVGVNGDSLTWRFPYEILLSLGSISGLKHSKGRAQGILLKLIPLSRAFIPKMSTTNCQSGLLCYRLI